MVGSVAGGWEWRPLSSFRRRCAVEDMAKGARELALLLAELAGTDPEVGDDMRIAPSLDYLADALGIDRSNLLRRRGLLEKGGLLTIEAPRPGTRTKVWRLIPTLDPSVSKRPDFNTDDTPASKPSRQCRFAPPTVSFCPSDSVVHAQAQPRNQETESGDVAPAPDPVRDASGLAWADAVALLQSAETVSAKPDDPGGISAGVQEDVRGPLRGEGEVAVEAGQRPLASPSAMDEFEAWLRAGPPPGEVSRRWSMTVRSTGWRALSEARKDQIAELVAQIEGSI